MSQFSPPDTLREHSNLLREAKVRDLTREKLATYWDYPWLRNTGQSTGSIQDVLQITDLQKVEDNHGDFGSWTDLTREASNRLASLIRHTNYSRSLEWGDISDLVRPEIIRISEEVILPEILRIGLVPKMVYSVRWDMMYTLMEVEWSDLIRPVFFLDRLDPLYQAGRLPCGWDGPTIDGSWSLPSTFGRVMPRAKIFIY